MRNLTSLLERFSKSLNKNSFTKETVIQVITKYSKVGLKPENISLKEGTLDITATPTVKNEINLKKEKILSELKDRYDISISKIFYK